MSDIKTLEHNTIKSFLNVKSDIAVLKDASKEQNDVIKQLYENQKKLLIRLREIETKLAEKQAEKVMEKKIILSSAKVAPTIVVQKTPKTSQFFASASAMKVHDPICPFGKNIKPKNKIVFKSKTKAFNQGFKACDCLKKV